jgi:hypothetical protein
MLASAILHYTGHEVASLGIRGSSDMSKRPFLWVALATIAVLLLVVMASAQSSVVLTNLDKTANGTLSSSGQLHADGFRTDAGGPYTLDAVTMRFVDDNNGEFTLSLYDDVAGDPGVAIATIGSVTFTKAGGDVDHVFTPASTITLANDTPYWLVLSGTKKQALRTNETGDFPVGQFTYIGHRRNPGDQWYSPSMSAMFAIHASEVTESDAQSPVIPVPHDGRLNHYGSTHAIYTPANCGIAVYGVDGDSEGRLVVWLSGAEVAAHPVPATLAEQSVPVAASADGKYAIYHLLSGEWQVNAGPFGEQGKIYATTFTMGADGCGSSGAHHSEMFVYPQ